MNKTASRWHRLLQLVGLVLIAVLSAEAGRAQEEDEPVTQCWDVDDCSYCHTTGSKCLGYFCFGDNPAIGITCNDEDDEDDENG